MINNLGLCIKQRIISTLCCSPTESSLTCLRGSIDNSHFFERLVISKINCLKLILLSRAINMFSATFNAGKREKC